MRLLIGVYLTFGVAMLALSAVIGFLGLRSLADGGPRRNGSGDSEALVVAAAIALIACVPLLAAFGLWRRWRVVRFVLLAHSCFNLGVSALVTTGAVAILAGLANSQELGFHESPEETLAIAFGLSVFAAWQAWVLLRPAVRQSFQRLPRTKLAPSVTGQDLFWGNYCTLALNTFTVGMSL